MAQSCITPGIEQILDVMISLTRLTRPQRVIVTGGDSMALYLALRQRGFSRTTTPALCRYKHMPHVIGFIAGQHSGAGIAADLEEISTYLTVNAGLALLAGSDESGLRIRAKLERLGFRIEAGVRCSDGLVLSASRQGYEQMARVA